MRFYNIVTNEYPRYQGDLELLGWTPENPLPENWVNVVDSDMPEAPENKIIREDLPKEINGVWTQSWKIDDLNIEDSGPPPTIKFSINR